MLNRILVVDDESDVEVLTSQRFRKRICVEDLSVQLASHGEDVPAKLQADNLVDVVLPDIHSPRALRGRTV